MTARESQVGGEHYSKLTIQPIDYIYANELGWCEANILKYITRWRDKGGLRAGQGHGLKNLLLVHTHQYLRRSAHPGAGARYRSERDKGVDPRHEGDANIPGVGSVRCKVRIDVATIKEHAGGVVLREEAQGNGVVDGERRIECLVWTTGEIVVRNAERMGSMIDDLLAAHADERIQPPAERRPSTSRPASTARPNSRSSSTRSSGSTRPPSRPVRTRCASPAPTS